jgi:hypothetical protein
MYFIPGYFDPVGLSSLFSLLYYGLILPPEMSKIFQIFRLWRVVFYALNWLSGASHVQK